MTLARYSDLIKHLPYLDQAFETKKGNWPVSASTNPLFLQFHEGSFVTDTLKLSRADLFEICEHNFNNAIFSIIFWGYPRNMRGNNFDSILKQLNKIESALQIPRNLSSEEFSKMVSHLHSTGVGLSTLSKFLYFFKYRLEGHKCLILDKRIMDVINYPDGFVEMKNLSLKDGITESNKIKKYVAYLKVMEDLSRNNGYESDQLEFFLFSMGKNLKPAKDHLKNYSLT